ncbi:MAG: glycosyltransferase family 4 protein, partial [Rhodospirillaceae bacterium]|nr:glycosyltransferase family 4 protein [Rhodospirillaceae bacterium]
ALEAMKYGTAVIGTRSGGIPDFVEDGVNGILVSPDNPAELARALVRLERSPSYRRQLALKGRETAARFTISSTVDQHINLYKELMA